MAEPDAFLDLPYSVPEGVLEGPFVSDHPREADTRFDAKDPAAVDQNNNFNVWIVPGKGTSSKPSHVAIIVNGFAEGDYGLYFNQDRGIARLLPELGITTVFLPIPFHLNRIPKSRLYRMAARMNKHWGSVPLVLCGARMERLYLGYRQLIYDIAKLTRELLQRSSPLYRDILGEDVRVHLLGYSIGGLACFSAALKMALLRELKRVPKEAVDTRFSSCTLLSSGASFLDLKPTAELEIPEDAWEGIREYYYKAKFLVDLENTADRIRKGELDSIRFRESLTYDVFARVVLGLPSKTVDMGKAFDSTYAILGNADEVVPSATILGEQSRDRGFPVLHVPALQHVFHDSRPWARVAPFVLSSVADFMKSTTLGEMPEPPTQSDVVEDERVILDGDGPSLLQQ